MTEREYGHLYRVLRTVTPLRAVVRKIRAVIERYRRPAWRLEGHERNSGQPMVIFYTGQLENKNYIAYLIFDSSCEEVDFGNIWLWSASRLGVSAGADMVITHMYRTYHRLFCRNEGFFIPCWIGMELNLEEAVRRFASSKSAKSDLRKISQNKLDYEVTRDHARFEQFYRTMYLPYVVSVHGDRTMLMTWEELSSELDRSELMLIKQDGEYVAGRVMQRMDDGRARARSIGVKDGDQRYVRAGAMAATYCFEIEYLSRKGFKRLHYGAARAFLNDGALRYKKKFGTKVADTDGWGFHIRPIRYSKCVKSFLCNNPFITEHQGLFYGNIFVEGLRTRVDKEELEKEIARHSLPGLTAHRVHVFGEVQPELEELGNHAVPLLVHSVDTSGKSKQTGFSTLI